MQRLHALERHLCLAASSTAPAAAAGFGSDIALDTLVRLRSGMQMPQFGLGTFLAETGGQCLTACEHALDMEYIMLDTAAMYNNEEEVGASLAGRDRSKIFVVTKLMPEDHGTQNTAKALEASLAKLGLDYVDLYLIHNPKGGKCIETWQAMLAIKAAGKAKVVGVSNFGVSHLQGLKDAGLEMPEVNQVELHIWGQQKQMVAFCKAEDIAVMGYCPLARVKRFGATGLAPLAKMLGKTEAQLCIRWSLQMGFITIPKSTTPKRIAENADVFGWQLDHEALTAIGSLDEGFKASGSVNSQDLPWAEVM